MKKNIILIGTHNEGKFKELSNLLPKKLKRLNPNQLGIKSPKETGHSFKANSLLKSIYFSKKSKLTVISDDSGLSINCLSGNPGIYSARWAKKYGSFKKAMQKILAMISDAKLKKNNKIIKAKFVCSLSYKKYGKKAINVNGIIYGRISNKIIGTNGFGYDPIFIPNGFSKTFGEMAKRKKMKVDHRYLAFEKLVKKIKTF